MLTKYHVSRNLFDTFDIVGQVPSVTGGALVNYNNGACTNYIDITTGLLSLSIYNTMVVYVFLYDENYTFLGWKNITTEGSITTETITNYQNARYARVRTDNYSTYQSNPYIMLNLGSTPLPYEPYGNTWTEIPYRILNTSQDTITSLPAEVIADGVNATAWTIYGNMQQTGTPTPSNPITPSECGGRTGNLCDMGNPRTINVRDTDVVVGTNQEISVTGTATANGGRNIPISEYIKLEAGTYTFSALGSYAGIGVFFEKKTDNSILCSVTMTNQTATFTVEEDIECYVGINVSIGTTYNATIKIMLNSGSTALPYEPYGFKLSVQCGGVVTPVYLNEPIRKIGEYADYKSNSAEYRVIKKLVLDGTETGWTKSGTYQGSFFAQVLTNINIEAHTEPAQYALCSHAPLVRFGNFANGTAIITGNATTKSINLWIGQPEWGVDEFKAYLQQQYAAGTPVTVWYVLATPTTTTVEAPEIPTTAGNQTLDVDTTLKPSKVELTYHGWHSRNPKQYEGSWEAQTRLLGLSTSILFPTENTDNSDIASEE